MTSSVTSILVFIDPTVDNYQSLLDGIDSTAHVVILNPNQDGIEQISQTLATHSGIDSVHIISHGASGHLQLGTAQLSLATLDRYTPLLEQWQSAMAVGADLLLYGCDVAAGDSGQAFVERLNQVTGADVAASIDLTGNGAHGGNWVLEKATGLIEAPLVISTEAVQAYQSVLATFTVTNVNDGGAGSLRDAIAQANITPGADVIQFDPTFFATPRTITLTSGSLSITEAVTIQGTGAQNLTISRSGSAFRIFRINAAGSTNLNGLTITNGNAAGDSGGGVYIDNGTVGLNNSALTNNSADANGGAIYNLGNLTLNNSTLSANSAVVSGGGIFNIVGSTTLSNSTLSGNRAGASGGGIFNSASTVTINTSTITNNTADNNNDSDGNGGGIFTTGGNVTLGNTIIAGNFDTPSNAGLGVIHREISGAVNGNNYNLVGGILGGTGTLGSGTDIVNANPGLAALRLNGGQTATHALLSTSPAINAGNPAGAGLLTDQRGAGFNRLVGDRLDIGAFEIQPPLTVVAIETTNPNPSKTNLINYTITLSQAATGVNSNDFVLVTSPGMTGARITNVMGSGAVYTVAVDAGTVDGTLRLDLVDDDSIVDVANAPLAGVGLGNGNFTGQTYIIDRTAPFLTSVVGVTPALRNSPVSTIAIKFSEAVQNVDLTDVSLTRNGVAVSLAGATLTGSGADWALSNLTAATTTDGVYQFILSPNDIQDIAGNALTTGTTASWTTDATAPTVTIRSVTPALRNSAVGTLTIQFSEVIQDFSKANLALTRDGVPVSLGVATLTSSDNINWTLGNLMGLTGTSGSYQLTLSTGSITDTAGNALVSSANQSWTIDLTPPTASIVTIAPDPRNLPVSSVGINFSEAVQNLDLSDVRLTRNGVTVSLAGATLTGSGATWTLGNLNALTDTEGSYQLTLLTNDITDIAGNALTANVSDSWVSDFTPPTAVFDPTAPNPRNSPVASLVLRLSETVGNVDLSDFRMTRNGVLVALDGVSLTAIDSTTWVLGNLGGLTNTAGNYQVTLTAATSGITDGVGNPLTANANNSWTMDLTAPTADIEDVSPDPGNAVVNSIAINFSEAVQNFDLSDLSLTRNGVAIPLASAILSSTNNTNWTLSNLEALTREDGNYQLLLATSDITDRANNALVSQVSDRWSIDLTVPTVDILDVAPDPRNASVNAVTVRFSEAVERFNLSDLTLTRNGINIPLRGASLSTDDGITWTLANLAELTDGDGGYTLTLQAANSRIADRAGNRLAMDASDTWVIDQDATSVRECKPGLILRGTRRNDVLLGSSGSDVIRGLRENDIIFGYGCNDRIFGNQGNDILNGDAGNDFLSGGIGNDTLVGGFGRDTLVGGKGADRFVYSGSSRAGAFADSVLVNRDRIMDFKHSEGDRFQLDFNSNLETSNRPKGLFNAGTIRARTLVAAARAAYADKDQVKAGTQSLGANEAVFFNWRRRTYLSMNNGMRTFSNTNDLFIEVNRMEFKPGDTKVGVLTVADYFR